MDIIQKTSTVHTSYLKGRKIQFLTIHYTAGTRSDKGVARNVAAMFANVGNRAASADFIVDDGEVVQYNGDIPNRYCYAVGGARYSSMSTSLGGRYYGTCKNYNSIAIELCSRKANKKSLLATDTDWSISPSVFENGAQLAAFLLKKYGIPFDHMIMHHEVNGKLCPQPWTLNETRLAGWRQFQDRVKAILGGGEKEDEMPEAEVKKYVAEQMAAMKEEILTAVAEMLPQEVIYNTVDEVPEWGRESVQKRVDSGVLLGTGSGLALTPEMVRFWVVADREENAKAHE